MSAPILSLRHLHKRYGSTVPADDFSMEVEKGEFFTMLGPSGSGKSTVLRMIAGLERPDRGEIVIEGRNMTRVPPWQRNLGMLFQQYANFPHMNVAANVAYGLRRGGLAKEIVAARVEELLALVGLEGFEERRVTQLSGGEQQRVAIARALAPRPSILLLDEPLSALDEKIRREMQSELRGIHARTGTTFIYVTHDQEEALTMSDRVAVLNAGRYVQCDAPGTIFRRPRTPFVAHFSRGCNVVSGAVAPRADGAIAVNIAGAEAVLPPTDRTLGSGLLAIRGESFLLGDAAAAGDLRLTAGIEEVTYRGLYTSFRLRLPDGQEVVAAHTNPPPLAAGDRIAVGARADDIVILEND